MVEQQCKPESFYRIIEPSVLGDYKLMMPDKFVERYGGELSESVRLTVPVGSIWHVGLEREGKLLWLHEGFQNFMEHYSIGSGYFLMFKYKGDSILYVHIFDLTATEICYPFSTKPAKRLDHFTRSRGLIYEENELFFDTDKTVQVMDSPEAGPMLCSFKDDALKECPGQEVLDGSKNVYLTNGGIDCAFNGGVHTQITDGSKLSCSKNSIQKAGSIQKKLLKEHEEKARSSSGGTSNYSQGRQATGQETERALHAAGRFKPRHPSFMAILKEYNVNNPFILSMPCKFSQENMSINARQYIKLQDSDGGKWPVRCIKECGKVRNLSKGWLTFVKEKNLGRRGWLCL